MGNFTSSSPQQFQSNYTKVMNKKEVEELLTRGDHLRWQRAAGHEHHGILEKIDKHKKILKVTSWDKEDGRMKICEQEIPYGPRKLYSDIFRINYSDDIINNNPPDLVLNRAREKIGDTGYNLFTNNCETFATYCKTGVKSSSQQVCVFFARILEIFTLVFVVDSLHESCIQSIKKCIFLMCSNEMHKVYRDECLPIKYILFVEICYICMHIWNLRKEAKLVTDYKEGIIRRIAEALGGIVFQVYSFKISHWLIRFVINFLGLIVVRYISSILGLFIAKCIYHDRGPEKVVPVVTVEDLEPGDHIVQTGPFHYRQHLIVSSRHERCVITTIGLIEGKGVFQRTMIINASACVYKVVHRPEYCLPNREVVQNARLEIRERRYSYQMYYSKHFVERCKLRIFQDRYNS